MTAERRLPVAIGASLLFNAVVWAAVGSAFAFHPVAPSPPIEIERIVLHPDGKRVVKIVKPEEVRKKVARIVKERPLVPPPEPKAVPEPPKPRPERPVATPRPTAPVPHRTAPPPPQGAHNRVLTAKPSPSAPTKPDFTALQGGNAPAGRPTAAQAPGTATANPASPLPVAPPPASETKPDSKATVAPADPGPKTQPKPVVAPPPPPVAPPPKPESKKKGPSRDAQYSNAVNPTFPDELKGQEFKKFVRVRVEIAADGSFQVVLRTSSGNDEVDKHVLDALKRWTWKPKLVDGEPVDSTQLFRFDFEIR